MASTGKTSSGRSDLKSEVTINVSYGDRPDFRWQMFFNAFEIERNHAGALIRVAYVLSRQGGERTAAEVVPFFVPHEGLLQLRESSAEYIQQFENTIPQAQPNLPGVRQFSPLFANHIRLSKSGTVGEISLYTVPIMQIASAARGQKNSTVVSCVQVGLLHSDILTHEQLILQLLASG
jgi:hypothetical protein